MTHQGPAMSDIPYTSDTLEIQDKNFFEGGRKSINIKQLVFYINNNNKNKNIKRGDRADFA